MCKNEYVGMRLEHATSKLQKKLPRLLDEVAPKPRSAFVCFRKPCARIRAKGTSGWLVVG